MEFTLKKLDCTKKKPIPVFLPNTESFNFAEELKLAPQYINTLP